MLVSSLLIVSCVVSAGAAAVRDLPADSEPPSPSSSHHSQLGFTGHKPGKPAPVKGTTVIATRESRARCLATAYLMRLDVAEQLDNNCHELYNCLNKLNISYVGGLSSCGEGMVLTKAGLLQAVHLALP